MGPSTIGERIRQLRLERQPRMTQRELAERAGVSVDLVSKLEQGQKQTALVTSLHKIARALDVDVSGLLARPSRIDTADDAEDDQGMIAIRRAITAITEEGEPAPAAELTQSASYAWQGYWANRFDLLGGLLPRFIETARASVRDIPAPEVYAALSDAYGVAASMLVHLGYIDLAYLAMERAGEAAEGTEDRLRQAAMRGWMSWLLLHQTGGLDQARRLAIAEADAVEPKLAKARPEEISVWGSLLVSAAVAAARENQPEEADDLLNLADAAATRQRAAGQPLRLDYQSPFGEPLVVMQTVDVAVVTARPGRALEVAKAMPPDAGLPLASQARHLADIAYAHTQLGRVRDATAALLQVERVAPHWMTYQSYPRVIVRDLLEHERRIRAPGLRGLATRLGVA
jgi:transcriptional regulator with XRE-family HTH domain